MRATFRTNSVTAYGIYKALRETTATGLSSKGIASIANFETTSESLREIEYELIDSGHPSIIAGGIKWWLQKD